MKKNNKEHLDKSVFKKQTFNEAEDHLEYWRSKTMDERLAARYRLSLRAYGHDPENPPKMDKTLFRKRKRSDS